MASLLHSRIGHGDTMLHIASQYGHAEVVQLLVDEYKLDPAARDIVSIYIRTCKFHVPEVHCNVQCP